MSLVINNENSILIWDFSLSVFHSFVLFHEGHELQIIMIINLLLKFLKFVFSWVPLVGHCNHWPFSQPFENILTPLISHWVFLAPAQPSVFAQKNPRSFVWEKTQVLTLLFATHTLMFVSLSEDRFVYLPVVGCFTLSPFGDLPRSFLIIT